MYTKLSSAEKFSTSLDLFPKELGKFWKFGVDKPNEIGEACIVCLHGLESHSGWFEYLFQNMSREFDFYGWDRLNVNGSLVNGIDTQVEAIVRILEFLYNKYHRVIVLGNSWGGVLGVYFRLHPALAKFEFEVVALAPVLFLKAKFFFPRMDLVLSIKRRRFYFYLPFELNDFTTNSRVKAWISEDSFRRQSISLETVFDIRKIRSKLNGKEFISNPLVRTKLKVILPTEDRILCYDKTSSWLNKNKIQYFSQGNCHAILLENPAYIASILRT